jgi:hypothetical protein
LSWKDDKLKVVGPINSGTASATKKVSSIALALSQHEIPINAPAITKVNKRGFFVPRATKKIAIRIGSTEIESGRSRTEFHVNCGASAASNPAITPALKGSNSATIKKIITAANASQAICTNCTAPSDDPNIEWIDAIRIE